MAVHAHCSTHAVQGVSDSLRGPMTVACAFVHRALVAFPWCISNIHPTFCNGLAGIRLTLEAAEQAASVLP